MVVTVPGPVPKPVQVRPPGRILASITLILCAGAVFGSMNLWPVSGRIFNLLNFVIVSATALALLVVGVVWCFRTVKFLRSEQPWSWMVVTAPAVVAIGLVLALTLPEPSFERSRPKFDAFVATLPTAGPVSVENHSIDAFDFSRITRYTDDTAIDFVDADTVFFSYTSGWIYSPGQPPPPPSNAELEYTCLGGAWYEFSMTYDF